MRIFATDLDGTLLDHDGKVRPRDARAIAEAREAGVVVTIATGRLTSGTLPIAEALGLDAPLVCADGGVTACAATRRVLRRRSIATGRVDALLSAMDARGLARFVFTHGAIHSCERGVRHHPYVSTWSPAITTHAELERAAWRDDEGGAVMVLAMGHAEAVDDLVDEARRTATDVESLAFTLERAKVRAARFILRGVSKGSALEDLARDLGVAREHVAVAGDWYNDLSMFGWAGRSFAMPHAPADVKAEATDVLDDEEHGVARCLSLLLGDAAG